MTTIKQMRDYMEKIKKDHTDDIYKKIEIGFEMIDGIPSPSMRKKMGDELYALIGFC